MMFSARTAVVLVGLVAAAVPQGSAPQIRVDAAQIFGDVEKLAADDMEGRLVGSAGGQRARDYVAARLKQAGVVPIGDRFERAVHLHVSNRRAAVRARTSLVPFAEPAIPTATSW